MSYVILQTDLYGKINIVSYNHGNDIAGLLMFYQIFLSPQVKRSPIIGNKQGVYVLTQEFPNNLRL